jgi:nucleoside-diphosphate-sugar epimerase
MSKYIAITGCFGHLATSIVPYLLYNFKNYKFILVDNINFKEINYLFFYSKYKKRVLFFNLDLSKKFDEKIFKKVSFLIHLAAFTDQEESFKNKSDFKKNNYGATLNIVNVCKKYKIPLIYPSTTSIYGSKKISDLNITSKSNNLIMPKTPYSVSKLKEEKLIEKSLDKYLILRLATVVGYSKGMKFHTAVNKFCLQSLLGKKITIWKTALNQIRPYLSIEHLREVVLLILKNNKKYINNKKINLVTQNYSIQEILKLIKNFKRINIKLVSALSMNKHNLKVENDIKV